MNIQLTHEKCPSFFLFEFWDISFCLWFLGHCVKLKPSHQTVLSWRGTNTMCAHSCMFLGCESKLQVSFAEYSLFYRALLQKRPVILRSLLIVDSKSRQHCVMWSFQFENKFSKVKEKMASIRCCLDLLSTISRLLQITGLFCKRAL